MTLSQQSFPILFSLLQAPAIEAETTGYFTAMTNYLWRGVTLSDDQPAIAVALEHRDIQGGYIGLWSSTTDYGNRPGYEVDVYFGQQFIIADTTLDLSARHYYFPRGSKYNYDFMTPKWEEEQSNSFAEIKVGLSRSAWSGGYSYSNNYLDSGEPGYYLDLNYSRPVHASVTLTLHVGAQTSDAIDDTPENRVGDYSTTIHWRNLFLSFSNLTDNVDGRQSDKARFIFGWRSRIVK